MLAHICMFLLSGPPLLLFYILSLLFAQTSRRQEYLADYHASSVAGSAAMVGLLSRLNMDGVFQNILTRAQAQSPSGDYPLLLVFRESARSTLANNFERITNDSARQATRLDLSHPPLLYRFQLLTERPALEAKLVLTTEQSQQMDKELAEIFTKIQKNLIIGALVPEGSTRD